MNPRLPDEQKKTRGTYRHDREYKKVDRDPDEKIPRRPSDLVGYGAKFWKTHVHQLWDDGWLCRKTVYSFVLVCDLYHDWQTLKRYCDEYGNYYEQIQQFGITKPMERPSPWPRQGPKPVARHRSQVSQCSKISLKPKTSSAGGTDQS